MIKNCRFLQRKRQFGFGIYPKAAALLLRELCICAFRLEIIVKRKGEDVDAVGVIHVEGAA